MIDDECIDSLKRAILAVHDELESLLRTLEQARPAGPRHRWVIDRECGEKQVRVRFDRYDREEDDS